TTDSVERVGHGIPVVEEMAQIIVQVPRTFQAPITFQAPVTVQVPITFQAPVT
ncbi:10000_t:CDS:2, partial [Dentiscutata heterogama]